MSTARFPRSLCATWLPACLVGAAATVASAQTAVPADPVAVLQRIGNAARSLSYAGVFVHATPEHATASRITHISENGEEFERIESLDGPIQEIIRHNDEMFCYQPDTKKVRIDRRLTGKFFPSLVNAAPQTVLENYTVKIGPTERISGFDCQWIILEPRDSLRYLQKFCAELASGLLLRARMLNENNQVLEQFTFTQLALGRDAVRDFGRGHVNKSRLREKQSGWQTDDAVGHDAKGVATGWTVTNPPHGFRQVVEMKRSIAGRPQPVSQLVFSDGIASISVFVEPLLNGAKGYTSATDDGVVSYAMRAVADHQVTALGEVPLGATQFIVESVAPRPR